MSWLDHSEQTGWPYDGRWLANSPQPAPDGYMFETYPGRGENYVATTAMAASGTIQETAIFLPAGVKLWKLAYMNGTSAGLSITHRWMQLKATEGRVLGSTADGGAPTTSALNSFNLAQVASALTNSTTTITATVATTVGLAVGDSITVSGLGSSWTSVNGTWAVTSVPTPTTFTFVVTTAPTGTWSAVSNGTATITMPIVTPYSGLYYLGLLVVASSSLPTLVGFPSVTALNGLAPVLCGTGAPSQTTPPTWNTIQTLTTAGANFFYGCVG